jgi:MFS family permease
MGLSLSLATASELVVFFSADRLMRRFGTRGLLVLALAATGCRLLGYSLTHSPGVAFGLQLLHGLSFSALWVAGVAIARHMAPEGMGATAQGLMGGVHFGLGGAVGGLSGGWLYEHVGPFRMYAVGGVLVLGAASFYWMTTRRVSRV